MLARAENLCKYGPEPPQFYQMLLPILQSFVQTFEQPDEQEVGKFPEKIQSNPYSNPVVP
jgi:hypothetical protein